MAGLRISLAAIAWLVILGAMLCKGQRGHENDQEFEVDKSIFPSQHKQSNNTCIPAHPPPFMDTSICQPYAYFKATNTGYCSKLLGRRLVFGSIANQKEKETRLADFTRQRCTEMLQEFDISKSCIRAVDDIYCNHYFPECDNTSATVLPRPICREACEVLILRYCKTEWSKAQQLNKELQFKNMKHFDLINCTKLPRREGGKIPECYYPKEFMEESCFYGDGQSYRGNVSETLSGYTCQSGLPSVLIGTTEHQTTFPELNNTRNACRNPGGQAPHGPWCYTTNREVRWEYCPIEECDENAKHRR
ncbi:hypothetical protein OS493_018637 [Desmophyllum pertusum]|uniref:Uncharacterized protein n=1 Tax=Desmophyllum pertusum TaxID=174260 RepID=A0A9W9ZPR6_9CNID|nr:hypothetical protein OS493_018637 [Desmophyllum pertusum]